MLWSRSWTCGPACWCCTASGTTGWSRRPRGSASGAPPLASASPCAHPPGPSALVSPAQQDSHRRHHLCASPCSGVHRGPDCAALLLAAPCLLPSMELKALHTCMRQLPRMTRPCAGPAPVTPVLPTFMQGLTRANTCARAAAGHRAAGGHPGAGQPARAAGAAGRPAAAGHGGRLRRAAQHAVRGQVAPGGAAPAAPHVITMRSAGVSTLPSAGVATLLRPLGRPRARASVATLLRPLGRPRARASIFSV